MVLQAWRTTTNPTAAYDAYDDLPISAVETVESKISNSLWKWLGISKMTKARMAITIQTPIVDWSNPSYGLRVKKGQCKKR